MTLRGYCVKKYNKLVRNKIPQIICSEHRKCSVRTLSKSELAMALRKKMSEEANEFERNGDIHELADILEIIHAYLQVKGMEFSVLEQIRIRKKKENGGFSRRLYLIEAEPRQ